MTPGTLVATRLLPAIRCREDHTKQYQGGLRGDHRAEGAGEPEARDQEVPRDPTRRPKGRGYDALEHEGA
jgi:hypothetical protein